MLDQWEPMDLLAALGLVDETTLLDPYGDADVYEGADALEGAYGSYGTATNLHPTPQPSHQPGSSHACPSP